MQPGMMPPPGGSNMDLMNLAAGGMMDPSMMGMALPNQCCTHGAMHCTTPDPATAGMMSTLPPIDPLAAGAGAMMTGLYDARTPHGGIKQKV